MAILILYTLQNRKLKTKSDQLFRSAKNVKILIKIAFESDTKINFAFPVSFQSEEIYLFQPTY